MVVSKKKKPKSAKPNVFSKIITIVVLIAFILCIAICVLDSFGIFSIKNIGYFWEGFFVCISFFSGYLIGDNANK